MATEALLDELGDVSVTPVAEACLRVEKLALEAILERHRQGDWDGATQGLLEEQRFSAAHGMRVFGTFALSDGRALRVETAPDRSATFVLMDEERRIEEVGLHDGYARWAPIYDAEPNPLVAVEQWIVDRWLAEREALPGRALDAAAGTGRHALGLAAAGWRVSAFDASPAMLDVARARGSERGLDITWWEGSLPEPDGLRRGYFDLVICALALAHVADLDGAVRTLADAATTGGTIILTDFHPDAYAIGWRTDCQRGGHRFLLPNEPHSRDAYLRAVERAGLVVETTLDAPLRDVPAGFISPAGIASFGAQPFCLAIRAVKAGNA